MTYGLLDRSGVSSGILKLWILNVYGTNDVYVRTVFGFGRDKYGNEKEKENVLLPPNRRVEW